MIIRKYFQEKRKGWSAPSTSSPTTGTVSRKRSAESIQAVPRLENVIVNIRDAGGQGRMTREFLLVFPAILTNVRAMRT